MKDCVLKVEFENGSMGVQMKGSTVDLVTASIAIVRGLYTSLTNAHGGKVAAMMFRSAIAEGLPFDDSNFDEHREECEDEEALASKMKAEKAKRQLGDIVSLLLNKDKQDEGKED